MESRLVHIRYEVFGRVQGVFFRKHTHGQANKLGLTGWVMNTHEGTVIGEAEGPRDTIETFKHWLRHTGSPSSQISDLRIHSESDVTVRKYGQFNIRK